MSQGNSSQTSVLFIPSSEGNGSTWSTPVLSSPKASAPYPNTLSDATPSSRLNPVLNILISMTTIVVGMAAISGAAYIAGGFVIAQLEAKSRPSQGLKPNQQRFGQSESVAPIAAAPQAQDSLDALARKHFNRANQLAESGRFQAAIAEANNISFNSLLYQQAQQSVSQWTEQMLQQDAEQRNMQQQLQAEHESNQRHLQFAQQALSQNDWLTALQEARQISNDPLWQQQREAIIQKAEPFEYEQRAKRFLDQNELENAVGEANKLPLVTPWIEKRSLIIEQANQRIADKEVVKKWNDRCREWAQDNISRCPNIEDVKNLEEVLPSNWISKFIPSERKPKR